MSKLSHTPGPWHYVDYSPQFNGCFPVYDIRDDNVSCVAEVVHTESDARLMTASPDILDALIRCFVRGVEGIGMSKSKQRRIRSLIESATGLPIEEVLK